jgi:hypothetical protein
MAPLTRSTTRPSTSTKPSKRKEYNTTKKAQFFDAYDDCKPSVFLRAIASEYTLSYTIAQRWLKYRTKLGSLVLYKTHKLRNQTSSPPKVSLNTYKLLVLLLQNPIRD